MVLTLTWLRYLAVSPFSVVRVLWHPKINQVRCYPIKITLQRQSARR